MYCFFGVYFQMYQYSEIPFSSIYCYSHYVRNVLVLKLFLFSPVSVFIEYFSRGLNPESDLSTSE